MTKQSNLAILNRVFVQLWWKAKKKCGIRFCEMHRVPIRKDTDERVHKARGSAPLSASFKFRTYVLYRVRS